ELSIAYDRWTMSEASHSWALLAAVASFGYYGLDDAEKDAAFYHWVSSNALEIRGVEASFAHIQADFERYDRTGEAAAAERVRAYHKTVTGILEERATKAKDAGRKALMERMLLLAREYLRDFDSLDVLKRNRWTVENDSAVLRIGMLNSITSLFYEGSADNDSATASTAGLALERFMEMLLSLAHLDQASGKEAVEASLALYDQTVTAIGVIADAAEIQDRKRLAESVLAMAPRYREALIRITGTMIEAGGLRKALEDKAKAFDELAGKVVESQRKTMTEVANGNSEHSAFIRTVMIALSLVAAGLGIGAAVLITRTIATPVRHTARVIDAVCRDQDLTMAAGYAGNDEIGQIVTSFNQLVVTLRNALASIASDTRQVAAASGEASTAIGQIADGSRHQFDSFQRISQAMRQTVVAVGEVARHAQEASGSARIAATITDGGQEKMQAVVSVVRSISENSRKINQITGIIGRIAAQTNMLSLNAAIEAARAGEHGKGFAVVAEEVRKLADSTSGSVEEIASLVQAAEKAVEDCATLVVEVNAAMADIAGAVVQSDSMMQRIAAAISQQSGAMEEINNHLSELTSIGSTNAAAAEEITATMMELSRLADRTRTELERFRVT
ncbi:MAG: methyl-accepting chemotaxis protein, partial [Rhodospirillales bacterium]|nr:methyl-accepting chemotaxis protein [Rhodospirillales bacterium]